MPIGRILRLAAPALAILLAACSSSEDAGPVAPPMPAPEAVADLVVVAGSDGALALAWTSPALPTVGGGAVGYDLRATEPGREDDPWDAWTALAAPAADPAGGARHEHTAGGLEAGRTYVLALRARQGSGPWSAISNRIVATAAVDCDRTRPAPIAGLRRWAGDLTSVTVAWAEGADDSVYGQASSYEVRWSLAPIDAGNFEAATPAGGEIVPCGKPGYMATTITGLSHLATCWVAVRAVDDAGLRSGLAPAVPALVDTMRLWYVNVDGTGDVPTIEAAVHAAGVGDTVLVAPGRYTWTNQGTGDAHFGLINVQRNHTGFTVLGEAGAEATIIDAERGGPCIVITGVVLGPGEEVSDWPGITLDGLTLTGGRANGQPGSADDAYTGGGLTMHLNSAHIRNCIIRGNEATQGGGVWYGGQGEPRLENVIIEDNTAEYGGGLVLVNSLYDIAVTGCTIRGNHARSQGGGVLVYNQRATFTDCVIEDNLSDNVGGGVMLGESAHLITLRDTVIRGNRADHGGAVYALRAPFLLERVTMVGNTVSGRGGAMMLTGDLQSAALDHCTVAGNVASLGCAIRTENTAFATITATLFADNTGGQTFSSHFGAGFALGCSDVWRPASDTSWPPRFTDLGGNVAADPLFCGPGDLRLQAASPCLPGQHPDGADCGGIGALGACGG